ncbi:TetR/AcrR family transcriptional regulator [Undibacterium parvum]|uniref:Helix-turn-helix transcriptional regulator n=2 Tax=Undibacterium TaxID=401469 RepID=A0A6M4A557_9BURK|nr:TetR/AcrR family transcriptional regulator [Undibacterium parvum]AZP11990.1 TetR/AcrR family transcriptional regulator [Undibacterium parvum]QJQ06354.1 helix-turn-helix transcriptional regulator [Undibacterium piscinae]
MKKKTAGALSAPRKAPQQARATLTCSSILQAAAHILGEHGLAGFNTNKVAERAGVSIGSLYQYYPNKQALLAALSEAQHQQLLDQLSGQVRQHEATPDADLPSLVKRLVGVALAHQFDQAGLAATLDYAERDYASTPVLQALRQQLINLLMSALAPYAAQIPGNLQSSAIDLQSIVQALIDGAAARGEVNSLQLKMRVERAALGYLHYRDDAH